MYIKKERKTERRRRMESETEKFLIKPKLIYRNPFLPLHDDDVVEGAENKYFHLTHAHPHPLTTQLESRQ